MKTPIIRLLLVLCLLPIAASAQKVDRTSSLGSLNAVHADLKRSYYDRTLRGYNLDVAYDSAKARINRANSDQEALHAIDLYLQPLNDSHTFFIAPRRVALRHFNFGIRFHGDAAFVTAVDTAPQADSSGLRVGDEIARLDGQPFTRASYEKVLGDFLASDPIRPLELAVLGPDRSLSQITVRADTAAIYRVKGAAFRKLLSSSRDSSELASSHVQATLADTVFLWRLPQFTHEDKGIDDVMKRVR